MGSPIIPTPDPPGTHDCPTCTPFPFPVGATPRLCHIVFHNVAACPGYADPPNDIPIGLIQDPVFPCIFNATIFYSGHWWFVELYINLATVYLRIFEPGVPPSFMGALAPCLPGPYNNTLTCALSAGENGTAYIIDLPNSLITTLALDYNLQPDTLALYDIVDSAIPDHKCVRLTGRTSPGSVLIDVDTTALP
jgi:hypothetical protein